MLRVQIPSIHLFAKDERLLLILRTIRGCGREVRYLLVKQNDDGSSPFSPVRLLSLIVQSGWLLTSRVAVRVRQKALIFRVWGSGRPLVLGTSPRKFDSCHLDFFTHRSSSPVQDSGLPGGKQRFKSATVLALRAVSLMEESFASNEFSAGSSPAPPLPTDLWVMLKRNGHRSSKPAVAGSSPATHFFAGGLLTTGY